MEATDWNIVIIGFWNPAILSPGGISTRLFQLAPDTPIQVEIAVDGISAPRVTYDNIVVIAEQRKLTIAPRVPSFEALEQASVIAGRALDGLPETPVSAGGFNLRWKNLEVTEAVSSMLEAGFDTQAADRDLTVLHRTSERQIQFGDGVINLSLGVKDGNQFSMQLNFHRETGSAAEIKAWLQQPNQSIRDIVKILAEDILAQQ